MPKRFLSTARKRKRPSYLDSLLNQPAVTTQQNNGLHFMSSVKQMGAKRRKTRLFGNLIGPQHKRKGSMKPRLQTPKKKRKLNFPKQTRRRSKRKGKIEVRPKMATPELKPELLPSTKRLRRKACHYSPISPLQEALLRGKKELFRLVKKNKRALSFLGIQPMQLSV